MTFRRAILLAAALCLPQVALAQTIEEDTAAVDPTHAEICYAGLTADLLIGSYELRTSPQRMSSRHGTMYIGNWEANPATIRHSDLLDYMLDLNRFDFPPVQLVEEDALEPDWRWDADPRLTAPGDASTGLSSEDVERVLACNIADLPRLSGTFTSTSKDGYRMHHTLRLAMVAEGLLFGSWKWHATLPEGRLDSVMSVTLTRR